MEIILSWFETVSQWVTLASPGGIHCVDQSSPEVTVLGTKVCTTHAWCSLSFTSSWCTMFAISCWANFSNPGYIYHQGWEMMPARQVLWNCDGLSCVGANLRSHLLVESAHVRPSPSLRCYQGISASSHTRSSLEK